MSSQPPWASLPVSLASVLRPHVDEVSEAIITALPLEVPTYARPLSGSFGDGVRRGVAVALGRFVDLPGTAAAALSPDEREVYVALGRGELRQGRELQALLAAYRVGARVAFRRFAERVGTAGLAADVLVGLAESVFAYIDELSAASVEGYALEQSSRAGESSRRRGEVLRLLLSTPVDAAAVEQAAERAGWRSPARLVAVLVPVEHADGLALRLDPAALTEQLEGAVLSLVPVPTTGAAARRLVEALAGRSAVVGPARPWQDAAASVQLARLAARSLPGGPDPLHVEQCLPELLLASAPAIAAELDARLAPLSQLSPASAERLESTLLAWLRHRGERQRIAEELHVHTQTVGYRLGQLRSLFGDALDQPDGRLALQLALTARASRQP